MIPKIKNKKDAIQVDYQIPITWNKNAHEYRKLTLPLSLRRIKNQLSLKYRTKVTCKNINCKECRNMSI